MRKVAGPGLAWTPSHAHGHACHFNSASPRRRESDNEISLEFQLVSTPEFLFGSVDARREEEEEEDEIGGERLNAKTVLLD